MHSSAPETFVSVLNAGYLSRAVAMHHSLCDACDRFQLRLYGMDETATRVLRKLDLPNVEVVGISELEADDPELAAVKETRSPKEYCQTAKASALLHVLERQPDIRSVTLLDADLYFYSDPGVLIDELGDDGSILLVAHRAIPQLQEMVAERGEYNTGFVTFRNDDRALDALRWWRERCLVWCYDRVEGGRYTDQRYVEDWPTTRPGTRVLAHPGGGLAPWNIDARVIDWDGPQITVDGRPLIFFHFQGLNLYPGLAGLRHSRPGETIFEIAKGPRPLVWANWSLRDMNTRERDLLWQPYVSQVVLALDKIERAEPGFEPAVSPPRALIARALLSSGGYEPLWRARRSPARMTLRLVKGPGTRKLFARLLKLAARSKHVRTHLLHQSTWEAALCEILVPQRMKLPSRPLATLFPEADAAKVTIDVIPDEAWSTGVQDLVALLKMVQLTGAKRVLELGSHRGLTAAYIARNLPDDGLVVAVDLDPDHGIAYRGTELENRIERRIGETSAALCEHDTAASYDLIFIDAPQAYEGVHADTDLALKLVSPRGYIVWHDYWNRGYFNQLSQVPEVLGELAESKPLVHVAESSLAVHSPAWDGPPPLLGGT